MATYALALIQDEGHHQLVDELHDLPLDTVEFLAEAEEAEVSSFMDGTPPKQPKAEQDMSKPTEMAAPEDGDDIGEGVSSGADSDSPGKFLPEGGRIIAESQIKLVPKDPAATIFYTLDGSTPSISSKKYNPTQAIVMDGTHGQEITVKAIMEKDGTVSDVMKAVFKIEGTLGMQAHEQRQIAEKYAAEARKEASAAFALAQTAVAKEEQAHLISHEAMKLVKHVENGESKSVVDFQAKARAAKADFFVAMENNKQKKKEALELEGSKKVLDPKVKVASDATISAQEDYDEAWANARTFGWTAWIAKDRAEGVASRAKTDKAVAEDQSTYAKAKLQEAIDRVNTLGVTASSAKASYEAAAQASEAADESNFFSNQLKEAEAREKRANEAKAVADADKKEKESAAAAARAAAAVAEAGDSSAQAIAAAKEAYQAAQVASELANTAAETALEEARAAKKAADAARVAMKSRGANAEAGLAAVNLENTARAAARKLEQAAYALKHTAIVYRQNAAGKKIKMNGDQAVLDRAKKAASQAAQWHAQTVNEMKTAQKDLDDHQAMIKAKKDEWLTAKAAEKDAIAAMGIARTDMDESNKMHALTDVALSKVVQARRNAWKSAYKTETANTQLTAAASKIARVSTQEKALAKQRQDKAAAGAKAAKDMFRDKEAQYNNAVKALEDAKDSGDADAVGTAERALSAAKSAKEAAAGAQSAAESAFNIVTAQCAKKVEAVASLDRAVQEMGVADASVKKAMDLGAQANKMMADSRASAKKAKELAEEAKKEHDFRTRDLTSKTENRIRLDGLIATSLVAEQRKIRYLNRAKKMEATWLANKKEAENHIPVIQKIFDDTKAVYDKANIEAKKNEDAAVGAVTAEQKKQAEIAASAKSVISLATAAGKDMLAKAWHVRVKWADAALADATSRKGTYDTQVAEALPALMATTAAEAAAERQYEAVVAKQENLEAEAAGPRNRLKIVLVQKQEEETKIKKEQTALDAQVKAAQVAQTKWQRELERLEKLRRTTALEALTLRIESIWKKRSKLHDPDRSQRIERSVYSAITAAWDRDGTPLGPGKIDDWYLDGSKITFSHKNQPGFLKEEVISRCSSACGEYADLSCSEGKVARTCTRGRVYRARFKRTGTIASENDWFICRCNSGVMQFAARESLDVVRQKNRLIQATVTPQGLTFDTRLHSEEMMPDTHVHCFRDFTKWLTTKTPFAKPSKEKFAELDSLALSKPDQAINAYNTVKKMWYDSCLKEAEPTASQPAGTHPGSTDGSLDIFNLKDQSYTKLDVKKLAITKPK
jgi:hypothetical protein